MTKKNITNVGFSLVFAWSTNLIRPQEQFLFAFCYCYNTISYNMIHLDTAVDRVLKCDVTKTKIMGYDATFGMTNKGEIYIFLCIEQL